MPKLERVKRRRKRVSVGDLSERIFVENRELIPPDFGDFDSNFEFTQHPEAAEVWALVETVSGVTFFDGVSGLDRAISHMVIMRFLPGIGAETWLRLDTGIRLDIVDATQLDERGEFIEIKAAATGDASRPAAGV